MNDAIIGGAIAAAMGAVAYVYVGVFQDWRREKARQREIVDALITETQENLAIWQTGLGREMWCIVRFRTDAYRAHKGQLSFLPDDVRANLIGAAITMDTCNTITQTMQLQEGFSQHVDKKPIPPVEPLIAQLELVHKALAEWRRKH
jgi:hypothetical protein